MSGNETARQATAFGLDPSPLPPPTGLQFDNTAQAKAVCKILADKVNDNMPRFLSGAVAKSFPGALDKYIVQFTAEAVEKILETADKEKPLTSEQGFASTDNGYFQMTGGVRFPGTEEGPSTFVGGDLEELLCTICGESSKVVMKTLGDAVFDTCTAYIDEAFLNTYGQAVGEYYSGCQDEEVYQILGTEWHWEVDMCSAFSHAMAEHVNKAFFEAVFGFVDEATRTASNALTRGRFRPRDVADMLAGRLFWSLSNTIKMLADGTVPISEEHALRLLSKEGPEALHKFWDWGWSRHGGGEAGGEVDSCREMMGDLSLSAGAEEGNGECEVGWGNEDGEGNGEYEWWGFEGGDIDLLFP